MFLSICYFLESETSKRPIFWRFVLKTWPLCFCHFTKNSIERSFLSSSWKFSNFRSVCFWWNGSQDGNIFRRNLEKKHFLSFPTVCVGTILFRTKVLKNDVETFFSVIFCSTRIETSSFRIQLIFLNATQLQKTRIKSESDFLVTNWALLWKQWYLVGLTLQALEWRLGFSLKNVWPIIVILVVWCSNPVTVFCSPGKFSELMFRVSYRICIGSVLGYF